MRFDLTSIPKEIWDEAYKYTQTRFSSYGLNADILNAITYFHLYDRNIKDAKELNIGQVEIGRLIREHVIKEAGFKDSIQVAEHQLKKAKESAAHTRAVIEALTDAFFQIEEGK